jgi:hypothetical protein
MLPAPLSLTSHSIEKEKEVMHLQSNDLVDKLTHGGALVERVGMVISTVVGQHS